MNAQKQTTEDQKSINTSGMYGQTEHNIEKK
jgi:hypothetical protein